MFLSLNVNLRCILHKVPAVALQCIDKQRFVFIARETFERRVGNLSDKMCPGRIIFKIPLDSHSIFVPALRNP